MSYGIMIQCDMATGSLTFRMGLMNSFHKGIIVGLLSVKNNF